MDRAFRLAVASAMARACSREPGLAAADTTPYGLMPDAQATLVWIKFVARDRANRAITHELRFFLHN